MKNSNKEIVKEFYPYVSEALKKMDNVDIETLKNTYDILSNMNDYSVDEVINAQKIVKDIINQTIVEFKDKLIKNVSFDDILLYAQVSKSVLKNSNKVKKNFFGNNTGVVIDTKNMVGTKSFEAIQHDLFGGKPTVYKKKKKMSKINDKVMLYSNIPYLTLKKNEHLYRIATLIPYNKQVVDDNVKGEKVRGLIYGMLPTMYFVTDNKKRDFIIARNNYINIVRSQNEKMVKRYEKTYGITLGYDISAKKIK